MANPKTVFIASDHAGFKAKEKIIQAIPEINWVDLGPFDTAPVDYPDYADRVAERVARGEGLGAIICGTGQGSAMRANRHMKVRAALVWSLDSTRLSREHNDANVICLGARLVSEQDQIAFIRLFFSTAFAGGRHQRRVDKIDRAITD